MLTIGPGNTHQVISNGEFDEFVLSMLGKESQVELLNRFLKVVVGVVKQLGVVLVEENSAGSIRLKNILLSGGILFTLLFLVLVNREDIWLDGRLPPLG